LPTSRFPGTDGESSGLGPRRTMSVGLGKPNGLPCRLRNKPSSGLLPLDMAFLLCSTGVSERGYTLVVLVSLGWESVCFFLTLNGCRESDPHSFILRLVGGIFLHFPLRRYPGDSSENISADPTPYMNLNRLSVTGAFPRHNGQPENPAQACQCARGLRNLTKLCDHNMNVDRA